MNLNLQNIVVRIRWENINQHPLFEKLVINKLKESKSKSYTSFKKASSDKKRLADWIRMFIVEKVKQSGSKDFKLHFQHINNLIYSEQEKNFSHGISFDVPLVCFGDFANNTIIHCRTTAMQKNNKSYYGLAWIYFTDQWDMSTVIDGFNRPKHVEEFDLCIFPLDLIDKDTWKDKKKISELFETFDVKLLSDQPIDNLCECAKGGYHYNSDPLIMGNKYIEFELDQFEFFR